MTAFVIVDLQNDFLPGGSLAVKDGNEIVSVIEKVLEYPFDTVVATKDWHPQNHGSFAINYGKQPGEVIDLEGLQQILWPLHCVQGTRGAEFGPGWDTSKVQKVFMKGTDPKVDSYSTFFDNAHRRSTGLSDYLKTNKITKVYIAGLATDYCVKNSAFDALDLGFEVFVLEDACRPVNLSPGDGKKALEQMREAGVHVIESRELAHK